MKRGLLEKLYETNGLKDYRLRTTEDLLRIHGINFKVVEGYHSLDDENRQLYEKFIVNLFNGLGLDSRMSMFPKGIYFVEDVDYVVKKNPEDDYFTVVGGLATIVEKNGTKTAHRSWWDKDYAHLEVTEGKTKTYLRFEYEHQGRNEWLHVIDQKTWY